MLAPRKLSATSRTITDTTNVLSKHHKHASESLGYDIIEARCQRELVVELDEPYASVDGHLKLESKPSSDLSCPMYGARGEVARGYGNVQVFDTDIKVIEGVLRRLGIVRKEVEIWVGSRARADQLVGVLAIGVSRGPGGGGGSRDVTGRRRSLEGRNYVVCCHCHGVERFMRQAAEGGRYGW
jgi:hypothetical protein